jgi:hypothetical protein
MPIVVTPPATSTDEQLNLDGIDLNASGGALQLTAFACPPPDKRPEWAQSVDSDGAALIRDPFFDSRTVTATVEVWATDRDQAHVLIGEIVAKLEESECQPDGLPLTWTPTRSSTSATFYVLSGVVTEIPIDPATPYFNIAPVVAISLSLTCKPFAYGTEVLAGTVTSSNPVVSLELPAIPGDVPAEGRVVVTDLASQARRLAEWGLEQRHYNPAVALTFTSTAMALLAGVSTTRAGSWGTNVVRATLLPYANQGIATVDNLAHVGLWKVRARVWASSTGTQVRVAYRQGAAGSWAPNAYNTAPVAAGWSVVDLGSVMLTAAEVGSQASSLRLEAFSQTSGDTVDIDYVWVTPQDSGYGVARTPGDMVSMAPTVVAWDDFDSMTIGAALDTRVAPGGGGTWATSGSTTDFTRTGGSSTSGQVFRAATSDVAVGGILGRLALYGSTSYTDVQIQGDVVLEDASDGNVRPRMIARYVDASNHLFLRKVPSSIAGKVKLELGTKIAATDTVLSSVDLPPLSHINLTLKLRVLASGLASAQLLIGSAVFAELAGTSTDLATGGTLATGKVGFWDQNIGGSNRVRFYDNMSVSTPTPEVLTVPSGRALHVHSDTTLIESADGVYTSPPGAVPRVTVPPAAGGGRESHGQVDGRCVAHGLRDGGAHGRVGGFDEGRRVRHA